jgi:hypothetical protein
MNNKGVVDSFKLISRYLPGDTEEDDENQDSVFSDRDLNPGLSKYEA